MTPLKESGRECLVTFSGDGIAKGEALLCEQNPLNAHAGQYIRVLLSGEAPACYKVITQNCAANMEASNITVFGETSRVERGKYTIATRWKFELHKLGSLSATSGMVLLILTWLSASLGTLNAAKVYDSGWHFDRVTPLTGSLLLLSFILGVATWLRDHLSK